jgi:hypothetical protein
MHLLDWWGEIRMSEVSRIEILSNLRALVEELEEDNDWTGECTILVYNEAGDSEDQTQVRLLNYCSLSSMVSGILGFIGAYFAVGVKTGVPLVPLISMLTHRILDKFIELMSNEVEGKEE